MADFSTTDLLPVGGGDAVVGGSGTDFLWSGSPPPDIDGALPDLKAIQIVQTDVGRDEFARYLGNKISGGYVTKFKLGEGAWEESEEVDDLINRGIGVSPADYSDSVGDPAVASVMFYTPMIPGTLTITAGAQTLTDDGNGVLSGDGTGVVNYKTGTWSVRFTNTVPGGTDIEASYKHRGIHANKQEDVGQGQLFTGPYNVNTTFFPIVPGSVVVSDGGSQNLYDDGDGNLTGDGTGTVNYVTGAIVVTFTSALPTASPVRAVYDVFLDPNEPNRFQTDLDSVEDSGLYTFTKTIDPSDIVFMGGGVVRITVRVELSEANDDGNGDPPCFFEGGLYTDNDVLVAYFTMYGTRKDSSVSIAQAIDLAM